MNRVTPDFCRRLAEARREQGISQTALAREAGCMQSAISMFEKGDPTKLAFETVEKIAKRLGVELVAQTATPSAEATPLRSPVRGFCPNCSCPSNIPYEVDGRVLFRPVRTIASPNGGRRCAECGEVLEERCPVCGAPLNDGACCAVCGSAYVAASLPAGADPQAWAQTRRAEIAEIRTLARG